MGLPLLLAARRDLYADGADVRGLSRGSAGVARLAPTQRGRKPEPASDHVWLVGRTAAHRMGGAVATGLSRCRAGAHRQCRFQSAPARCVRRTHGRHLPSAQRRPCSRRVSLGPATDVDRASGTNLGAAGRWNLGSERRTPPFYLFQDHGLGCSRSYGARCGAVQIARTAGPLATRPRPHARDHLRVWIRHAAATPSCKASAAASSMRVCC